MRAEVKLSEVGQIDEARELLKITASYQDVEYKLAGHCLHGFTYDATRVFPTQLALAGAHQAASGYSVMVSLCSAFSWL